MSDNSVAARLLDNGATGVIVSGINDSEAARRAVEMLRYPPLGQRSVGPTPQLGDAGAGKKQSAEIINVQTLIGVVVSTAAGFANIPQIAAVSGIDVILIDHQQLYDERNRKALYAAAKHRVRGKSPAFGILSAKGDDLATYKSLGFQLLLGPSDASLINEALATRMTFLRAGLHRMKSPDKGI